VVIVVCLVNRLNSSALTAHCSGEEFMNVSNSLVKNLAMPETLNNCTDALTKHIFAVPGNRDSFLANLGCQGVWFES
jgi:hypothetical protein